MRIPFLLFLIFLVFIIAPSANAGGLYHHHYCPIEMLRDEDPVVRTDAAVALGECGAPPDCAVPTLIDALVDDDWLVVRAAYDSLMKVDRSAEPALIEALYSGNDNKFTYCSYILSLMKPLSSRTVFAFMDNFENPEGSGWVLQSLADASGEYEFITDAIIRRLDSSDARISKRALRTLGTIGPAARKAVPLLLYILKEQEPSVSFESLEDPMVVVSKSYTKAGEYRALLVETLARIGADADDILPLLFDYLWFQSGNGFVPERVINFLDPDPAELVEKIVEKVEETGESGFAEEALIALGADAILYLYDFLEGDNELLRAIAASVLLEIKPVSEQTVMKLRDAVQLKNNSDVLRSLGELGPEYAVITLPLIIESYESDDVEMRRAAVASIPKLGTAGWDAIPILFRALDDSDTTISMGAYYRLSQMGPPYPDEIIDKLITRLNHPFAAHRKLAAQSLWYIGPYAIRAEDKLIARLDDWSEDVQEEAIRALTAIHLDGSKIIPVFKDKLKSGEDLTIYDFMAINKMGSDAAGLTEELIGFLANADNPSLRFNAAVSLSKIGFQARQAASLFWDILRDDEQVNLHPAAAVALERFGEFKPEIVDILLNDMKTVEASERYRYISALGEIGPDAAAAVPELVRILGEGEADSPVIAEAIGQIGYAAPGAVTRLKLYAEYNDQTEIDAHYALFMLGEDPEYHLQRLIDALNSESLGVVGKAFSYLGQIGPAASAAIPVLKEKTMYRGEMSDLVRGRAFEVFRLIEAQN